MQQDLFTTSGDWQTAADWSTGSLPTATQDAYIGVDPSSPVKATSNKDETVNSIGTAAGSKLTIYGDSTFTASNGTVLSPSTPPTLWQNNVGTVQVNVGSTLAIGNTFDNEGTLNVGQSTTGTGQGYLKLTDAVTLGGAGTVNLGNATGKLYSMGKVTGVGLANVDDAIKGGGFVYVTTFDNEAHGVVDATHANAHSLSINAKTFTNAGEMNVETLAHLDLGGDGATNSLTNTGSINIGWDGSHADVDATLAIRGDMTVSGSGHIAMKGAGAKITSDGKGPATLSNESTIEAFASGQIGDAGVYGGGVNDLTFDNSGTTVADGKGVTLTLNTGANTIGDGGGLLEAENGATLAIDSNVATGELRLLLHPLPPGGTIEAAAGGTITLSASVSDGIHPPPLVLTVAGQVDVDAGGVFDVLSGGSIADNVFVSGPTTGEAAGVLSVGPGGSVSGTVTLENSGAILKLNGSTSMVDVTGVGGIIQMHDASVDIVGGADDTFDMAQLFGKDTIQGFNGSTSIEFSKSDFSSFAVLQSHMAQSGANTTITLDANDLITLDHVKASTLGASQFSFV